MPRSRSRSRSAPSEAACSVAPSSSCDGAGAFVPDPFDKLWARGEVDVEEVFAAGGSQAQEPAAPTPTATPLALAFRRGASPQGPDMPVPSSHDTVAQADIEVEDSPPPPKVAAPSEGSVDSVEPTLAIPSEPIGPRVHPPPPAAQCDSDSDEAVGMTMPTVPCLKADKWDYCSSASEEGGDNPVTASAWDMGDASEPQPMAAVPEVADSHRATPERVGAADTLVPKPSPVGAALHSFLSARAPRGTEWWYDYVWKFFQPLAENVPTSSPAQYLTEHLCFGTGADIFVLEALGFNFRVLGAAERKPVAVKFLKYHFQKRLTHLFHENCSLLEGCGKCSMHSRQKQCEAPTERPHIATAGLPCQPFSRIRTTTGATSRTGKYDQHPDYATVTGQWVCYLRERQLAAFWFEEVVEIESAVDKATGRSVLYTLAKQCAREGYTMRAFKLSHSEWVHFRRTRTARAGARREGLWVVSTFRAIARSPSRVLRG